MTNKQLPKLLFINSFNLSEETPPTFFDVTLVNITQKSFRNSVNAQFCVTGKNFLNPVARGWRCIQRSGVMSLFHRCNHFVVGSDRLYIFERTPRVYLDLAKAFDRVLHKILLYKLKTSGISGPWLRGFDSFAGDRKHATKIKNVKSHERTSEYMEYNSVHGYRSSVWGKKISTILSKKHLPSLKRRNFTVHKTRKSKPGKTTICSNQTTET